MNKSNSFDKTFVQRDLTFEGGFVIKPLIVITALLLVAGCTGNHPADKKAAPQPSKVRPYVRHSASTSTLTQASSISAKGASAKGAGQSSIGMKQAPGDPQLPADPSQFAQQVLELVNQARMNAGLQPLNENRRLSNMAMAKAQDMYNNHYFDHQSPTYGSPFDMMKAFGITYSTAGENIALGQTSPTEVMNQWMSSPGHRANILNGSYTQIGVAYYNGEWVQEFIG
jgi:uncharacterized YkwD family protein